MNTTTESNQMSNRAEVTWTRLSDGYAVKYLGSNGAVITRKGIGSKIYSGRNRQGGNKGHYYQLNGKGWFGTLAAAKAAAL